MRQRREVVNGSLHVRDAILPTKILKMHLRRNLLSQISLVECVQCMLKEDDRSYETNESMILDQLSYS